MIQSYREQEPIRLQPGPLALEELDELVSTPEFAEWTLALSGEEVRESIRLDGHTAEGAIQKQARELGSFLMEGLLDPVQVTVELSRIASELGLQETRIITAIGLGFGEAGLPGWDDPLKSVY